VLAAAALLAPLALPVLPASAADGVVRIEVLSGRADLVTGGDAYLRVLLPDGTGADGLHVDVDGRDVTPAFAVRQAGVDAVVTGLHLGRNVVTAALPDGRAARLVLVDHPIGGPVFSGPQIRPWTCSGKVADAQCNRAPSYAYKYKSVLGGSLKDYDPANPPPDVATTTTDQGKRVPFIVRVETGNTVRDQYAIAVLDEPAQPWDPTKPQPGYNGKLVLTHGASCDTAYAMGTAPDVLLEDALSRGFAVASHALDNAGHNCNLVTEAESLVVTKELVAERYGPIRYTIGTGCSGGSLVQQQVANAYPGIYQGILPQCSFTDAWSSAQQYVDYTLLRRYFETPGVADPSVAPDSPTFLRAAYGHPNLANPITFTEVIPNSGKPTRSCPGVPAAQVYDEKSNPTGVRCTLQDYMVNVFGRSDDGKARRPYDNVGIQYALSGLLDGTVTPAQFVDLNTKVGGYDIDLTPVPQRTAADPLALARVFRSGAVNTAAHLDDVAIIDLRGPDPGAFHDVYRTRSMTDRLVREHGTSANQVLWEGPVPLLGSTAYVTQGIRAMDAWLAVVEKDTRSVPLAQKVLDARPVARVNNRCADAQGNDRPGMTSCPEVDATRFSSPRIEAGGGPSVAGYADDRMKCALVPVRSFDYGRTLSDAQLGALEHAFPNGVCDYSKPSVAKQAAVTWLTYQDEQGGVVVGGRPLGAPPASTPFRATPAAGSAGRPQPAAPGTDPAAPGSGRGQQQVAARPAPAALARTGLPAGLAAVGGLLLLAGVVLHRRRRQEPAAAG
jgi:hypothetical protein